MVEQGLAVPGVLGGHPVHLAEHLESATGQVVQVTDRCADHYKGAAHGGVFLIGCKELCHATDPFRNQGPSGVIRDLQNAYNSGFFPK